VTEPSPPLPFGERALARIKRLANGNGLDTATLVPYEVQECILSIDGKMNVSPLCETESTAYIGPVRGKNTQLLPSLQELQGRVEQHQRSFREDKSWVEAVVTELKAHPSQGWGLESAKVVLSKKSTVYAASQICPNCQGRKVLTCEQCLGKGTVVCTQCQGQGRELCYHCNGRGEDPQQPGQRCRICEGVRTAPCRFCHTRGFLPCPTCDGKGGLPCQTCKSTGVLTQEVKVTCGAETHFSVSYDDLPAGFRRGLGRIGIPNLANGHADIDTMPPPQKNEKKVSDQEPTTVLLYRATMPYAEIKIDLAGKKALVSAVGKRCALTGVPNFLDHSLKPWRDKLRLATIGQAPLEEALKARALKDILALTVAGKDTERNVRRSYPFGMSSEIIGLLLKDMRLALKRTTLAIRTAVAIFCGVLCALLFYSFFAGGLEQRLTQGHDAASSLVLDMIVLAGTLAGSWGILNFSTRFALQCRFPTLPFTFQQKIGKTGVFMLVGIFALFVVFLLFAQAKPLWLMAFAPK